MASIFVNGIRILTPSEYDIFVKAINKPYQSRRFKILFYSGLRYAEFERFYHNPEWYDPDRNTIHIPHKKVKSINSGRYVHPLPDLFADLLDNFFNDPEPATRQGWDQFLKRNAIKSGLNPMGISAKCTRKTIESYLIASGVTESAVYLRQGHDRITSLNHYQGLPFTPDEKTEIKRRLAGMI